MDSLHARVWGGAEGRVECRCGWSEDIGERDPWLLIAEHFQRSDGTILSPLTDSNVFRPRRSDNKGDTWTTW